MWQALGAASLAGALAACGGADAPPASASANAATADASPDQRIAGVAGLYLVSTSQRDAVRLADQASFGASEALVADIRRLGAPFWIAGQLQTKGSRYSSGGGDQIHRPVVADYCAGRDEQCVRDNFSSIPLLWDFYRNALSQPDQLRQRMAFALGQIMVVSALEVDGTYGLRAFHNMLLDNALGNYRELLRRVTLSPLMGEYLNHVNNDRLRPNENYAREMLQLFSIGPCLLNADGSLAGGRCLPAFDNAVVRGHAYALTGWTYPAGGTAPGPCWPLQGHCRYLQGDMVAVPALHDDQPRALLGGRSLSASRTPAQALDQLLDAVMAHGNTAPFVARQLIQHLVKSNPSPAYVQRVSEAFVAGRYLQAGRSFGQGRRGDLAATVAAILLDTQARGDAPGQAADRLREPVLMMTGVLRALQGSSDGDALGWWWGDKLRQHVFRAPSVFNFYPPDYPVTGSGRVGPAFGIHNANTALARLNFLNQLLFWGGMPAYPGVPGAIGTHVDLAPWRADAANPPALVQRLSALATGGRLSASAAARISAAVQAVPDQPADPGDDWRSQRVRTAAYLVFASPDYQVVP